MSPFFRSFLLVSALMLPLASGAFAQGAPPEPEEGPGIRFNGLGRSLIQQTGIGGTLLDTDSLSVENLTDGEFVLDLAINGQPNDVTEVQGVIRLRNEFGGFFGSGVTVEVRELWARGIIADALRYRVGDMDVALTPYTLFLPDEDGVVNEPEVFLPQKEVVYYEEFYTGLNERRLQGAKLDFGLEFERGVDAVDVQSFLARLRSTNFVDTPTRLIGGGRIGTTSQRFGPYQTQARLGVNLAYTWDDLQSGDANTGIRNSVVSFDTDVTLFEQEGLAIHLVGEAGRSMVELTTAEDDDASPDGETPPDGEGEGGGGEIPGDDVENKDTDTFVELGLAATLKGPAITVSAQFVDVGPDFYSSAAQSRRVDYTRTKSFYNRIGNDRDLRMPSLFDLTRDPAIYTYRVADELMRYDPRYNNVLPYGRATPNRRGVRLDAAYAPTDGPVDAALTTAVLSEIRGQGTTELKDFLLVRAETDVRVGQFIGWDRTLEVTLGLQYESTNRGGEDVERVDLTSTLFEAGLAVEVYDRLDLLLGTKVRTSSGRDYVPLIENFNDVRDFPGEFVTDDQEALLGTGLRYRFRDGIYLTLQYQRFNYSDDATPADDYSLDQVFALYSMTF